MREQGSGSRWAFTIVVVLTVVFVVLPFMAGDGAQMLRDRHSDPTPEVIPPAVAVAMSGKLYHDPRCTFIHGRAILEPPSVAIAQGFSPCPRCLGTLRGARHSTASPHGLIAP